ncbi:MAG: DNA methyltransferase, partial [Methanoregula sp.]|nr:DNA methyltransferase [Methanoregula sp.]
VLDPFNGAGTTSLVARKQGRRFIGIDLSEQYCDMALKRVTGADIAQETSDGNPYPTILTIKDLKKRKMGGRPAIIPADSV